MTAKRFEFREINELPILPKCYDTEKQEYANLFECVGWLNELQEEKEMWKRECERLKGLYYLENEKDEHLAWKRIDVK